MKWILFIFMAKGAAPVTPEHYLALMQEFDDRPACESAIEILKKAARETRVGGICLPKASEPKSSGG